MDDGASSYRDVPHLELRCFGPPTALVNGQPAPQVVLWRKHLALLVYLAVSPDRTRTRSHLQGLLWPEKSDLHARHSLNQAVKLLRDQLGDDRLVSQAEALSLAGNRLTVDVLHLSELADRDPEEAARLLRGDFLEGFVVDDAPPYEEWAANERTRLRLLAATTLVKGGERALHTIRHRDAMDMAHRALAIEPFYEPAIGLLIRAAALSGDIAGALAAFQEFALRLEAQLGERPSRDLASLADRVRSMRWRRFAAIRGEEEPPLVGRAMIHEQAFALVQSGISQGPRTLLITGDPGTGRTRLLAECVERLALAGGVIAAARPLECDQDIPWSTLRALLRAGLLKAPGSVAADPQGLATLATLESTGSVDAAAVATALGALIPAVAEEQAVGIVLDDAHYADGASLAALGAAASQLRRVPVVLLITSLHTWDEMPRALVQLRGDIGRTLQGLTSRLENLSQAEAHEMVATWSSWCETDAAKGRLARRLFFETGGNPFLLVTLLRGLAEAAPLRKQVSKWPPPGGTSESQMPISVPSLARRAVMARLAELDKESMRVFQTACIGSQAIDVELVAALTELSRPTVEDHLAQLERHRLVTFDGDRFVLAAPVLGEVVRADSLLPGELRTLRSRAITVLETRSDLESRLVRAQLLAATSAGPAACDEALAVAEAAFETASMRMAGRALAAAERGLTASDEIRRKRLEELQTRLRDGQRGNELQETS